MKKLILFISALTIFGICNAQDTTSSWTSSIFHEVNGNTETWTISDPPLEVREIVFADIIFQACDEITIAASSCVLAGGKGNVKPTYANPEGKTDTLYYGTISVPGLTNGFERIRRYNQNHYEITSLPQSFDAMGPCLKLGYTEEPRNSNSFTPRNNNQSCSNKASVTLTITHYPGTQPAPASSKEQYVYWTYKKGKVAADSGQTGSIAPITKETKAGKTDNAGLSAISAQEANLKAIADK